MLHWWVGGADLSTFDYLYGGGSRYMDTHNASVETVLVYKSFDVCHHTAKGHLSLLRYRLGQSSVESLAVSPHTC